MIRLSVGRGKTWQNYVRNEIGKGTRLFPSPSPRREAPPRMHIARLSASARTPLFQQARIFPGSYSEAFVVDLSAGLSQLLLVSLALGSS